MNLLTTHLLEDSDLGGLIARAQYSKIDIVSSLTRYGLLPASVPGSVLNHPAVRAARLDVVPVAAWGDGPPTGFDPETLPDRWTRVVRSGDWVFLVPEDNVTPDGDIQLFSRADGHPGRLRFLGQPSERGLESVTRAVFETSLHCADTACDDDNDCGGCSDCCPGCRCKRGLYHGYEGLRCHCDTHNMS